jgi:type I restriction enzyme S subunit
MARQGARKGGSAARTAGKKAAAALTPEEKLQQALVPVEEQPYKVPENWCWCRVSSICNFERGITFPASAKEHNTTEKNIPCLRTANIQDKLKIDDLLYVDKRYMKNNGAKFVRADDIIMSSANSRELVGKTSYVDYVPFPMTFGGFVLTIRAKEIKSKFLFYYLRFEFLSGKFMGESTQTTNIANINTTKLGNYEIPLPPLPEQQRIVDRIESLFAKLDEAKEKAQAVVDGFELRKSAILHRAFTGELTKEWRQEHGVGMESWKNFLLKECCQIGSGGTPSRKHPEYYNGHIPWIKTGEINWNTIESADESVSDEAIENSSAKIYQPGAVLVAMYGMGVTRGRAAVLAVPATTNQAVCVLQPNDYLLNRYLFYYFMCNYWTVREQSVGGNQLNLSATIIGKFQIAIPQLDEQAEVVRILDDLLSKEQQAKDAAEAVLDQIDTMKKAILARAFRGELGTNDPSDDSAVELLRGIL